MLGSVSAVWLGCIRIWCLGGYGSFVVWFGLVACVREGLEGFWCLVSCLVECFVSLGVWFAIMNTPCTGTERAIRLAGCRLSDWFNDCRPAKSK